MALHKHFKNKLNLTNTINKIEVLTLHIALWGIKGLQEECKRGGHGARGAAFTCSLNVILTTNLPGRKCSHFVDEEAEALRHCAFGQHTADRDGMKV